LEHEFDRRVEEFHLQSNGNEHDDERSTAMGVSLTRTRSANMRVTCDANAFSLQMSSVVSTSPSKPTDEMNEFDEKSVDTMMNDDIAIVPSRLKRRLEQYEHDRQVERAHVNRMQAKREADIEARLRKDRVCRQSTSFPCSSDERRTILFVQRIATFEPIEICAT
jgi:hypothetical protein